MEGGLQTHTPSRMAGRTKWPTWRTAGRTSRLERLEEAIWRRSMLRCVLDTRVLALISPRSLAAADLISAGLYPGVQR